MSHERDLRHLGHLIATSFKPVSRGCDLSTVRLGMAAIRGLFAYMIGTGAVDVMFNPAANVKIKGHKIEFVWPSPSQRLPRLMHNSFVFKGLP